MLWPPGLTFIARKSVKNMRMKQYVVIIFCQDIIVGKFCPCIFPSCHGLFLVLIPCQYHVWLSSYISSGKFRKIPEWAKNAIILSILFLSRSRTQKKDNFGTLNTHTHTHTHHKTISYSEFLHETALSNNLILCPKARSQSDW